MRDSSKLDPSLLGKMSFDNDGQVDVAFLDFSKAFDGVSHLVLLKTLRGFGVSGSFPRWCKS